MEYERGRGSSKHLRTNFETTYDEGEPLTLGSSSSDSSLSDSSSLELNIGEKDVLRSSLLKSEQTGLGLQGPISSPEVSSHTSVISVQSGSAMQCPPIQMMGRPVGYDPNRIPASVFGSRPATPIEWSVASNESLFSIHMGNNSFSRDHFILLCRSQELTNPDEVSNLPASMFPVTEAVETIRMSATIGKGSEVIEASAETTKVVLSESTEDCIKEKLPPAEGIRYSVSASYHSDGSINSTCSFSFPELAGEGGRNISVKVDTEKQRSQPQTPGANPNAAGTKWFSCSSCYPRCC